MNDLMLLLRSSVLITAFCILAAAAELPKANLEPVASSGDQAVKLAQAVKAHDRGEFDVAIRTYRELLAANPDDVEALYELAFSQTEVGAYRDCAETAKRGARYRSPLLGRIRMMLANCLDLSGQAKRAAKIYQESIVESPEDYLLRFNYAVTLASLERSKEAMSAVKTALTLNPEHASSHILLAQLYEAAGLRAPAVLASLRALVLEPRSPRSGPVLQRLHALLQTRAVSDGEDGGINISVDLSIDTDDSEGDFSAFEMMLAIAAAAERLPERREQAQSAVQSSLTRLRMLIESAADSDEDPKPSAFAMRFYVPYFAQAHQEQHLETIAYVAYSSSVLDEVADWIAENPEKVEAMEAWSERFAPWQGVEIRN